MVIIIFSVASLAAGFVAGYFAGKRRARRA
jgi:hypothetical protein